MSRPTNLTDGLRVVDLPASPRGFQIKCVWCQCSVSVSHVPGSADCLMSCDERTISQTADPW